jgi:hypothetical protein
MAKVPASGDIPIPHSDDELERRIRERAYQLWDSEGRQMGKDEEYWLRACEMIEAEQTAKASS